MELRQEREEMDQLWDQMWAKGITKFFIINLVNLLNTTQVLEH